MLKIKVKAGLITNLTDARYFAAREVSWLGFPVGNQPGMIEAMKVKAIAEWVDGVEVVAEFGIEEPAAINSLAEGIGIKTVQVGTFYTLEQIKQLEGLNIIKEIVVNDELGFTNLKEHLSQFSGHCMAFLLNFSAAGYSFEHLENNQTPYSIQQLYAICQSYPIILHLDCEVEKVTRLTTDIQPLALSLHGGEEERVGVKSFDDLDEILDALEIEE